MAYMARSHLTRKAYFLDTFQGFNYAEAKQSTEVGFAGTHRVWPTPELAVDAIRAKLQQVAESWQVSELGGLKDQDTIYDL